MTTGSERNLRDRDCAHGCAYMHTYFFCLMDVKPVRCSRQNYVSLSLALSRTLSLSLLSPRSGLWLGPPSMPRRGSSLSLPLSEAWPLAGLSIYASSWVVSLSPFNGKLLFFHGRGYLNLPRCTLQKLNSQWRCTHEKTASDPRPSVTFASRISTTS
jgi:hypothetical protein